MWGDHPVHGTTTAVRVGNVDLLDNLEESYPSRLEVQLSRSDVTDPWGFAIQGGFDQGVPLSVQRVFPGSSAEGQLTRGEAILAVDGVESATLTHLQALELITRAGTELTLTIDPRRSTTNRSAALPTPHRSVSQADPRQGPRTSAWAAQLDDSTEYYSDDAGATKIAAGRQRSAGSTIRFASTTSVNTLPSGFNEMGWTPKANKPASSSAAHKSLSKPWVPKTSTSRQAASHDVGWAPKPRPASAFFTPKPTSTVAEESWTDHTPQATPVSPPDTYEAPAWGTYNEPLQPVAASGQNVSRQQWQPNGRGGIEEPQVPAWYGSLRSSAGTRRPWQGGGAPRSPQKGRGEDGDEGWIPQGSKRKQEADFGGHESRWIKEQTACINAQGIDFQQPQAHEYQHSLPVLQETPDRREWEAVDGAKQHRSKLQSESENRRFKSELHDIHLVSTTWTPPVQDPVSQSRQPRQAVAYAGPLPTAQNQQRDTWQGPVQAAQASSHSVVPVHRSQQQQPQQQQQQQQLQQHQQLQQQHQQRAPDRVAPVAAAVRFNPPPVVVPHPAVQTPPKSVEQRISTTPVGPVQPIPAADNRVALETNTTVVRPSTTEVHPHASPTVQPTSNAAYSAVGVSSKGGVEKTSAFGDFYVASASTAVVQTAHVSVNTKIVEGKSTVAAKLVEVAPAFNDFYVIPISPDVKVQAPVTSTKSTPDTKSALVTKSAPDKPAEVKATFPDKSSVDRVVNIPAFGDFYVLPASNDVKASAASANTQSPPSVNTQGAATSANTQSAPAKSVDSKVIVFDKSSRTSAFDDFYVLPASSDTSSPVSVTPVSAKVSVEKSAAVTVEKSSAFEDFYVKSASSGVQIPAVPATAVVVPPAAKVETKNEEPLKTPVSADASKVDVKGVKLPVAEVKAKEGATAEPATQPKGNVIPPPSVVEKPAPAVAPAPKGKLTMPSAFGNKSPPGKLKPK